MFASCFNRSFLVTPPHRGFIRDSSVSATSHSLQPYSFTTMSKYTEPLYSFDTPETKILKTLLASYTLNDNIK